MGNRFGQQRPQRPSGPWLDHSGYYNTHGWIQRYSIRHVDNGDRPTRPTEQTTVYIYVKLQPNEKEGNWNWKQMLQQISDVYTHVYMLYMYNRHLLFSIGII